MKKLLVLAMMLPLFVNAQTVYTLSAKESRIFWQGNYPTGKGHEGYFLLRPGTLTLYPDGRIAVSDLVIDMNSVRVTDMAPDNGGKDLESHLKGDDFFSTTLFPTASFSLVKNAALKVSATPQNVRGALTMKGLRNNLSFPASITRQGSQVRIRAKFSIDRTLWNIRYQSAGLLKMLKENVISDDVPIRLDLVFNPQAK